MSGHNKVEIDPNLPYQKSEVGVRGIVYFTIGLFLLIVVTFSLMYVFQYMVMEPEWAAADEKSKSDMALTQEEKLPPEPRLQGAPGFGVDSKDGRINLERREPQAEYRELYKQWEELWANGTQDEQTKTVISLSMEQAKEKVLTGGTVKSAAPEAGAEAIQKATMNISDSSAGRLKTSRVR